MWSILVIVVIVSLLVPIGAPLVAGVGSPSMEFFVTKVPSSASIGSFQHVCGKVGRVPPLTFSGMTRYDATNETSLVAAFPSYCSIAGTVSLTVTSSIVGFTAVSPVVVLGAPKVQRVFPSFGPSTGGTVVIVELTDVDANMLLSSVNFFGVLAFSENAVADTGLYRTVAVRTVTPRVSNYDPEKLSTVFFSGQATLNTANFAFYLQEKPFVSFVDTFWMVGTLRGTVKIVLGNVGVSSLQITVATPSQKQESIG